MAGKSRSLPRLRKLTAVGKEKIEIDIKNAHKHSFRSYYSINERKRKRRLFPRFRLAFRYYFFPSSRTASSAKELSISVLNATRFASSPFESMISCSLVKASSVMTGVFIQESVSR